MPKNPSVTLNVEAKDYQLLRLELLNDTEAQLRDAQEEAKKATAAAKLAAEVAATATTEKLQAETKRAEAAAEVARLAATAATENAKAEAAAKLAADKAAAKLAADKAEQAEIEKLAADDAADDAAAEVARLTAETARLAAAEAKQAPLTSALVVNSSDPLDDLEQFESRLDKLFQQKKGGGHLELNESDSPALMVALHKKFLKVVAEFTNTEKITPEDLQNGKSKNKFTDEKLEKFHKDGYRMYNGFEISSLNDNEFILTKKPQAASLDDSTQETPYQEVHIKLIPVKEDNPKTVLSITGTPAYQPNIINIMIEAALQAKKLLKLGSNFKYIIYPHSDIAKVKELYEKADKYKLNPVIRDLPANHPNHQGTQFDTFHEQITGEKPPAPAAPKTQSSNPTLAINKPPRPHG